MKEKSGMQKLIELLNEYDENRKIGKNGLYKWEEYEPNEEYVISKQFGFIKWLVENDKIDIHNIPPISITKGGEETAYNEPVMLDDSLLMLLAISDTPIEDLISYLR